MHSKVNRLKAEGFFEARFDVHTQESLCYFCTGIPQSLAQVDITASFDGTEVFRHVIVIFLKS